MRPTWLSLWIASSAWAEPVEAVEETPEPPAEVASEPVAATARIEGVLLELGSGDPVAGWVRVGDHTVLVGPDGRFALDVPPGPVVVAAGGDDHEDDRFEEEAVEGEVVKVKYRLEPYSRTAEMVIYGEAPREEVSRHVFSARELTTIPGTFGDPIRALQSLPGVARAGAMGGDVIVRGAEAANTGTYLDEMPVPFLFHWLIGRSVVNPALLDEVAFYPGGMPSQYGDVTQAVVDARTRIEAPQRGVHGRVRSDILDGSVGMNGKIGDWSWAAGATYSWLPGVISLATAIATGSWKDPSYRPATVLFHYLDYNLRATRRIGDDVISVNVFGARDELSFREEAWDEDGDGHWDRPTTHDDLPFDPLELMTAGFHRVQLRWDHEGERHRSVTWAMYGFDEQSSVLSGVDGFTSGPEQGRQRHHTVRVVRQDRLVLSDAFTLRGGALFEVEALRVDAWRDVVRTGDEVVTHDLPLTVGPWIEPQLRWRGLWVAPGLRVDVLRFNGALGVELEPRLSIRQRVHPRWTLTGFVGRFVQVPEGYRYADGIGNPELGTMSSWQASAGVEGRWPSGLEVDVTLFGSLMPVLNVQDYEVRVAKAADWELDVATTVRTPVFRDVYGRAYGAEAMVRYRPTNGWFGWAAFTWARALRTDAEGTFRGDYDQPLTVTLVGARTLSRGWRLAARYQGTSGQPFTPEHAVWFQDAGAWVGLPGERNSARLPDYHRLDLRIDKTWVGKRAQWTFYLDVLNATNRKNTYFATYNWNYERLVKAVTLPIIPSPGLEVSF